MASPVRVGFCLQDCVVLSNVVELVAFACLRERQLNNIKTHNTGRPCGDIIKKSTRVRYFPRCDPLYTTSNPIPIRIMGQRLAILAQEYVLSRSELNPIKMMIIPNIIGPEDLFRPPKHSSSISQLRLLILLPNCSARSPNSSACSSISSSQFLLSR